MLDVGWTELMVIGVVALLVIGPKDLPEMFRQLGRITAKMRAMARDFNRAMNEAAKQSGMTDVANDLKAATSAKATGLDAVKSAADKFEKWDPMKNAAKPTVPIKATTVPASNLASAPASMPAAVPVVAASDPAPAPATIHGPATTALAEQQAAKKAILQDTAEKLKAVRSGVASVAAKTAAPAKPRVRAVKATEPAEAATKPRAPRKSKKADVA